jgi:tetratricopeptide (TPR) repeat protein
LLDAEHALTLGDLYYNAGIYDLAATRYDGAAANASPERLVRIAHAMYAVGRFDDAARYLEAAKSRLQTGSARARVEASLLEGRLALERSDRAAARSAFEAALEADPLSGEALLALGALHHDAGEFERSSLAFERASRIEGIAHRAHVELARLEVERGRYARAVEHLEAAQAVSPDRRIGRYLEQVKRLAPPESR